MNQSEKDEDNWYYIECGLNADRRGNGRKGWELWRGRLKGMIYELDKWIEWVRVDGLKGWGW